MQIRLLCLLLYGAVLLPAEPVSSALKSGDHIPDVMLRAESELRLEPGKILDAAKLAASAGKKM